jgi:hypothetical protein
MFKITPAGTLTTLYTFSSTEGQYIQAGLVLGADGDFYGGSNLGLREDWKVGWHSGPGLQQFFSGEVWRSAGYRCHANGHNLPQRYGSCRRAHRSGHSDHWHNYADHPANA